jgi:pyruvate dehydrogenase E2 component (dihydrolipoamide acetyltransferase)
MAIEIRMPALSPTMTTGTLAKWLVGEGDRVNSGDVIAEIETDKATMEVESVDDGIMAKIFVDAGAENVAVGAVIAVLAEDDETASDVAKTSLQEPSSAAPVPSVASEAQAPTKPAPALVTAAPVAAAAPFPETKSSDKPRAFVSPLARRIAADRNIVLDRITGSGPHGRILRRDVESAATAASRKQPQHWQGQHRQGQHRQGRPRKLTAILLPIARCARQLLAGFRTQNSRHHIST